MFYELNWYASVITWLFSVTLLSHYRQNEHYCFWTHIPHQWQWGEWSISPARCVGLLWSIMLHVGRIMMIMMIIMTMLWLGTCHLHVQSVYRLFSISKHSSDVWQGVCRVSDQPDNNIPSHKDNENHWFCDAIANRNKVLYNRPESTINCGPIQQQHWCP